MRNLKKVLTLVLTFAMLLSVMVVGAGAATFGDQESITNKEAVDVCTTLNIIGGYEDGTFRPAGNVTRAEMCKMICVALNGGKEPTLGSNSVNTFNDVANDNWAKPYIEYCVSEGIVGGVGGGNFNPAGNITGTQAAKMLLCILGYDASIAGYVGNDNWEMKINVDASSKHLYNGITSIDASAPLTRDQAAQMIWNALQAYEVEYVNTFVPGPNGTLISQATVRDKVVGNNNDYITLLQDKYEAQIFTGVFDGDYNLNGLALYDGQIQVTGAVDEDRADSPANFTYDFDLSYIGEEVKVLFRDSYDGKAYQPDDKDTIYGVFLTERTNVLNVTRNDIDTYDTTGRVTINDKVYRVAQEGVIMYNFGGEKSDLLWDSSSDGDAAIDALIKATGDTVKFVLNEGNEIEGVYVVDSDLFKVTAASGDKITISGIGTIDKTVNNNEVYDGVAANDVVAVTKLYDRDLKLATYVVEKAESVTGTLNAYSGTKTIELDGKTYDVYNKANMKDNLTDDGVLQITRPYLDSNFTLYLVNGYVRAANPNDGDKFAIVLNVSGTFGSSFYEPRVELMFADGTKGTVTVHDDSTIYETTIAAAPGATVNSASGTPLSKGDALSDGLQVNQIVKYTVMPNEQYRIDEVGNYTNPNANKSPLYDKNNVKFDGTVTSDDCVLFYIDGDGTMKAIGIRGLDSIDLVSGKLYASVKDSTGKVVATYIQKDGGVTDAASVTLYGIITEDWTDRGNNIGGKPYYDYEIYTNEGTVEVSVNGDRSKGYLEPGMLVSFVKSSDGLYEQSQTRTDFTILSDTTNDNVCQSDAGTSKAIAVAANKLNGDLVEYASVVKKEADGSYRSAETDVARLANDCKFLYVDAKNGEEGSDLGGEIPSFSDETGFSNVLLVLDADGNVAAVIVNTNSGKNGCDIFGHTDHVYGAKQLTVTAGTGFTASADKTWVVPGDEVTVTVEVIGTAGQVVSADTPVTVTLAGLTGATTITVPKDTLVGGQVSETFTVGVNTTYSVALTGTVTTVTPPAP